MAFDEVAAFDAVPSMREPLAALSGMRQSCPEDHCEIAVVALLLQNVTIARTTQMTRNLHTHHGRLVHFDGITLRAWFTPAELTDVTPETLKEQDRLGYRAKTLPHFAALFRDHTTEVLQAADDLVQTFLQIKGVGRTPPRSRPLMPLATPTLSAWTCGTARSSLDGSWTPTMPNLRPSPAA
ncbi:DNA glycosylase family protein [Streptomyces atratus]|uniref:hypothetical protein n=1 Tax=Streptomyces atratus TaxID=1893 RepID=UPI00366996B8